MNLSSLPQLFALAIDRFLARMARLTIMRRKGRRLMEEAKAFEGQAPGSSLRFHVPATLIMLGLIGYFVVLRIGYYFNWPPDVYHHPQVYNLTTRGITWDVYYGSHEPCGIPDCMMSGETGRHFFQKQMILPAREFPLRDYQKGQTIYYRTSLRVPADLVDKSRSEDSLVFHSVYIWAKTFDFYVNGVLLASGGKELLNLSIPRTLIPESGQVTLGFRIDPGDLPYQGLAHRGDLVIGPRSLLAPTAFVAEERRTVFFLWFLLPKLAFCIMFAMLYLAVAQRSAIFFFCLYGFLSALDVFFSSGYASDMIPWVSGPHVELVSRILASLALSRFIMDFCRRSTKRVKHVLSGISLALSLGMGLVWLILGSKWAMDIFSSIAAVVKPAVLIHGAYSALVVSIHLADEQRSPVRSRIMFCIGVVMALSIPAQLYESFRWVIDLLGMSGNTPGIYLYLVWIFDLLLFVVLSAVMATEFGMNLLKKKRLSTALDAIRERLGLAQSVQLMLMPRDQAGRFGDVDYRIFFSPAEEVSGDWFQVWQDADSLTIFQGDVVGKGPSAALSVSIVVGILTECRRSKVPVEDAIQRIGAGLFDLFGGAVNTTLSAIHITQQGAQVTLFACGSIGWFWLDEAEAQYLVIRGTPLGQTAAPQVGVKVIDWPEGRAFFTFTDGCLEGSRAVKKLLQKLKESSSDIRRSGLKVNEVVIETGKNFVHADDQTLTFLVRGVRQDADSVKEAS